MSEHVRDEVTTGLLIGRYLRFRGGRVWHRIRAVRDTGGFYSLPTVCGASGDEIAEVEVGDAPWPCSKCEAAWDARTTSNGRDQA